MWIKKYCMLSCFHHMTGLVMHAFTKENICLQVKTYGLRLFPFIFNQLDSWDCDDNPAQLVSHVNKYLVTQFLWATRYFFHSQIKVKSTLCVSPCSCLCVMVLYWCILWQSVSDTTVEFRWYNLHRNQKIKCLIWKLYYPNIIVYKGKELYIRKMYYAE